MHENRAAKYMFLVNKHFSETFSHTKKQVCNFLPFLRFNPSGACLPQEAMLTHTRNCFWLACLKNLMHNFPFLFLRHNRFGKLNVEKRWNNSQEHVFQRKITRGIFKEMFKQAINSERFTRNVVQMPY